MTTTALAWLAAHTWIAVAAALGAFLVLFLALHVLARTTSVKPETTRKLFHTGSGILTLTFPFVFRETWPVFMLTGASATFVGLVKFVPPVRARLGRVTNRVERMTLGEIYFPLAVALVFWLARDSDPLLFVIPVLVLTVADATCAAVGGRYGRTPYVGASKSLEGSVAFAVVAFFCIHVPLLVWSTVGRVESLLISLTLALLVMLLEGSAWRGLDNLFIPVGGYFLLHAYLTMDTPALASRLLATLALVVLIVAARQRMTLEDDSLVAAAFLCYVAWAVMGWRWLVGPMAVAAGYRWLSPRTPDNSRRMHGVPAVLSVWAAAIAWLSIARASRDASYLLPYTAVFAAHLAMFGTSRLAFQFHAVPIARLLCRAVATSWAMVVVPLVIVVGVTGPAMASAGGTLAALAIGTAVFVATQPGIRDLPQSARRWTFQAGAAALASILSWGAGMLAAWVLA